MGQKWFIFIVTALLLTVLTGHTHAAPTLPNGLSLISFEVQANKPALVGDKVDVQFTLKNLEPKPIKFDPPGVFVGARCNEQNRDFGHRGDIKELKEGQSVSIKASIKLDTQGEWRFWPAFKINNSWGPYGWMEKRVSVFTTKAGASESLTPLTVSKLLANKEKYDKKMVTVIGNAFIVRKKADSNKQNPWTLISLIDLKDNKIVMNVFSTGHAPVVNGDNIKVTGIFKIKSPRGRYTFDNEIDARNGSIEKIR
jgi:hypothetical protein